MATGTVAITPGSGQAIAFDTNAGLAGGAAVQLFSPVNSDGTRQPFDPDGTIQVSPEATSLLLDDFGAQAITIFHTVGSGNSGTTPAASAGNVPISAGTASGGYAVMRSTNPYWLRAGTYLRIAHLISFETAAATANSTRWWGYGVNQTTPTATAPVLNGAVFQLDSSAGAFQAAVYSAGTKTVVATLTKPTDGIQHKYEIHYRQSVVYWMIDGLIVATKTYPNLAVATGLYAIAGAANAAAITAPAFNLSSVSVSDQGGNNRTLSDGFNPSLQATVKAAATAISGNDFALAVGIHPSSPLPTGGNFIGTTRLGSTAPVSFAYTTTASTNAQSIRAATMFVHEISISNPTSSAAYLKIYNLAAAPTVGTSAPIMIIRIPPTGNAGDFQQISFGVNGKYLSTGFAWAVTGGVAASDTTASVAGILIHTTYA